MREYLLYRWAVGPYLALVVLMACGGPPRAVRVGVEQLAVALDLTDELLARRIEIAGTEARAQIRDEVRRRLILGVSDEETIALALERYEELMAPYTLARAALRVARHGALSLDDVLDAWEAGDGGAEALAPAAACALAALSDVVNALIAAEVEVPDALTNAMSWLAPWAEVACPAGDAT